MVRQVLGTRAAYIGVIGSSKKAAATRERLEGEGFGPADIARLTTPIGLSIGAETPQEIAVSIPVSYTHLDVYKRQVHGLPHGDPRRPRRVPEV